MFSWLLKLIFGSESEPEYSEPLPVDWHSFLKDDINDLSLMLVTVGGHLIQGPKLEWMERGRFVAYPYNCKYTLCFRGMCLTNGKSMSLEMKFDSPRHVTYGDQLRLSWDCGVRPEEERRQYAKQEYSI